ncbi:MAG: helix-turn-helix transcriptional regulator [Bacteroidaceae bacterium]|nr:helix-turn-helix transcriptional regulator [Bacteroidaceae bacterium]
MEFCDKLKDLRAEKGVSQAKLAADIHISRSAVAKWENGLGLPNDESLKLLSEYFGVSIDELLPDKPTAETIVSKNKTIDQQKKVILGFSIGCAIGLFILAFIFIEPLRDSLELLGIGTIIAVLGIFNLRGNIGSIHWYNRRKVSKEDQLPYCRCVGLGTLLIGAAMIISGFLQALVSVEAGAVVILIGIIIGLVLILYAQFKYNRGIF